MTDQYTGPHHQRFCKEWEAFDQGIAVMADWLRHITDWLRHITH